MCALPIFQVFVEFAPGAAAPRHSHPGEELVYVVEGVLEYQLDGKPPVTLKAGDVLFIPSGGVHAVKNVGSGKAAERSEEHTSELQSLMRISYAVFCLKKKKRANNNEEIQHSIQQRTSQP